MTSRFEYFKHVDCHWVRCDRSDYEAWAEKCSRDPFYATSHVLDYKRMDFDLDEFEEGTRQ